MHNPLETPNWLLNISKKFKFGMLFLLCLLFLPWNQFSSGEGEVIALNPLDRIQEIHAPINGFIKKWFVQEGTTVKKGDPLVELSDLDTDLLQRMEFELQASKTAIDASKMALETAKLNQNRQQQLWNQGLSSRKEFEKAKIEVAKYEMEFSKAQSTVIKAERDLARQHTQKIIAPHDGVVLRLRSGQGAQVFKQGDSLLILTPTNVPLAAEIWLNPNDIPIIKNGMKARLVFAGWPSVQVSGWPSIAIGTFKAKVLVVDSVASLKGKFRVLLVQDGPWPSSDFLKQGARVKGFVVMKNVTLFWEIWRQLNGFPADGLDVQDELVKLMEKTK